MRLNELTSESSTAPGGPGRLTVASSSRGKYWRQAIDIFDAHQGLGAGAGTFGVARLRYRKDDLVARHAHGYLPQTAADLGLAGLLLSVLLTGAWLVAALRAVGVRPLGGALATRLLRDPRPPPDWSYERAGLTALGLASMRVAMALVFLGLIVGLGLLGIASALGGWSGTFLLALGILGGLAAFVTGLALFFNIAWRGRE